MRTINDNKIWTSEEIEYLKAKWKSQSDEEIAKELDRTKNGVSYMRQELQLLRQTKKKPWEQWEIDYLKEHFYDTSQDEIVATLGRKWGSIKSYASKILKIKRQHGKYLSKDRLWRMCKECGKTLPNTKEYFYSDRSGLRCTCIECDFKIAEQKRRDEGIITNRLKHEKFVDGLKYCYKCSSWKRIDEFYASNNNKIENHTDLHRWCISCSRDYYLARQVYLLFSNLGILGRWKIQEFGLIYKALVNGESESDIANKFPNRKDTTNKIAIIKNYIVKLGAGKILYASDGTTCQSIPELLITEFFIQNNIKYKRSPFYKELIISDSTKRRFDWKVFINNKWWYIEYFGLYESVPTGDLTEKYKEKADQKICDLKNNNIINRCLLIYPETINATSISDIFNDFFNCEFSEVQNAHEKIISQYSDLTDEELYEKAMKHSTDGKFPKARILHNHFSGIYNEIKKRYEKYKDFSQLSFV